MGFCKSSKGIFVKRIINKKSKIIFVTPAATVISNILGYIGVFVISLVLLWVAAIVLTKLVERITFLHRINTALGALLGLLIAVTLLFVAASVIKFISAESELYTGSVIVKFFGDSALLEKLKFLNIGNLLNK